MLLILIRNQFNKFADCFHGPFTSILSSSSYLDTWIRIIKFNLNSYSLPNSNVLKRKGNISNNSPFNFHTFTVFYSPYTLLPPLQPLHRRKPTDGKGNLIKHRNPKVFLKRMNMERKKSIFFISIKTF